jgi:uncharacterized Ntn-hydrolase superfamily protein
MIESRPKFAATYSVVARCPTSGDMGVAIQSSYFSVGTEAPWAEAGVGAVATQSIVEVSYGPKGLASLSEGASPEEALSALTKADAGQPLRQVAIVDAQGRVATHTGAMCVPAYGDQQGDGYSVQGNMLDSDDVWKAMGPAFEAVSGDLADRLLATLDAAEHAGGDVRGRQSAALLVVSGDRPANPWEGRRIDLHVEDDPHPLEELRRLLSIRRAYDLFEEARDLLGQGDLEGGLQKVELARELKPGDPQLAFWAGLALGSAGRDEEARRLLDEAFSVSEGWRELARRLRDIGFYSGDPNLIEP